MRLLSLFYVVIFVGALLPVQAQNLNEMSRAELIFNVAVNVEWPEENKINTFKIGVLEQEPFVHNDLQQMVKSHQIHWKRTKVYHFKTIEDIKPTQILFVYSPLDYDAEAIFEKIAQEPTLLITEGFEFNQSMINYITVDGNRSFEINQNHTRRQGLIIAQELLDMAVKDMSDWRKVQQRTELKLKLLRMKMRQLQATIGKQNEHIENQKADIARQEAHNLSQKQEYDSLKQQVMGKQYTIDQKTRILLQQQLEMESQRDSLTRQLEDIEQQKDILRSQKDSISSQNKRIAKQTKVLEKQMFQIERQRRVMLLYWVVFVLIVAVGLVMYRGYKIKKKAAKDLAEKNQAIQQQNKEVEKSRREAEHANRAKSLFLANMSHEIRTPMNAILGFADLLTTVIKDRVQRNYLDSIKLSGKNLLILINDILDLSKIEAGKMEIHYEAVNLPALISELEQVFLLKTNEKNLEIRVELKKNLPSNIILDEVRLRQILFNLLGNAVKFTDQGYVKIIAEARNIGEKSCDLVLSVEDSGIGIPVDARETIFESFRQQEGQTTKKYGGTGLGLSITQGLVKMMNGNISVESELGKGSRFDVYFREVDLAQSTDFQRLKDEDFDCLNVVFEPATVLVVDDVDDNRNLIDAYLGFTELKRIEAIDGQQAVEMAIAHQPDLILMDIRMPVMDGIEANRLIKANEKTKDIPVVVITASGMKRDRNKINASRFDGFLIKPVQQSDLFKMMMRYLPYKLKQTDVDKSVDRLNAAEERSEVSDQLLEQLDVAMLPLWESIQEAHLMTDIINFANQLTQLGQTYHCRQVLNYGKDLRACADSFDIQLMDKSLDDFPALLTKLKNQEVMTNYKTERE